MSEFGKENGWDDSYKVINGLYDELGNLLGQIGDLQINRAYDAVTDDKSDTLNVASELVDTANNLLMFEDPEPAISMLEMFEGMHITESIETADIFAIYRSAKMRLWNQSNSITDSEYIGLIIDEQEQSLCQKPINTLELYKTAYNLGYEPCFNKYLKLAFNMVEVSEEKASEYDPTPVMHKETNFLMDVFMQDAEYLEYYDPQSVKFKEHELIAQEHINIFVNNFRESKRKALIAHRMGYKLHFFYDNPTSQATSKLALSSLVNMYIEAIESPVDRSDETITYNRLHKNLIMDLIRLSYKFPELYFDIDAKLNEWMQNGFFTETDLKRTQVWSIKEACLYKPKNRKRKKGNSSPMPI